MRAVDRFRPERILCRRMYLTSARLVEAGVYHQAVKPGGKLRLAAKPADVREQLQEDLLSDVAGRRPVAVKEIGGYRIHTVLIEIVKLAEGKAIPVPALRDERGAGL